MHCQPWTINAPPYPVYSGAGHGTECALCFGEARSFYMVSGSAHKSAITVLPKFELVLGDKKRTWPLEKEPWSGPAVRRTSE